VTRPRLPPIDCDLKHGMPCTSSTSWPYLQNPPMAPRSKAETEELLTVADAALILRLSVGMVRVLHGKGRLAAMRTPRGYRLFRRSDVERLAREREGRA
jgi:excisionase family DNA binding protein